MQICIFSQYVAKDEAIRSQTREDASKSTSNIPLKDIQRKKDASMGLLKTESRYKNSHLGDNEKGITKNRSMNEAEMKDHEIDTLANKHIYEKDEIAVTAEHVENGNHTHFY